MSKSVELIMTIFNTFPHAGLLMVFMLIIGGLNFGYGKFTYADEHDIDRLSQQIYQGQVKDSIRSLKSQISATKREIFSYGRIEKDLLTERDKKHRDELIIHLSNIEAELVAENSKVKHEN